MPKITREDLDRAEEIVQRLCYGKEQMDKRDMDLATLLIDIYDRGYSDAIGDHL